MKILFLVYSLTCLTLFSYSQNEADIFRYSKTGIGGTARYMAMGGSFGALGAEISGAQSNPGGLGKFSNSVATITFQQALNNSISTFNGNETTTNRAPFTVPNFGVVITNDISTKNKGDLYEQFSFGLNRIQDYKYSYNYNGQQYASLLDEMVSQANGYAPEELSYYFPFSTSLAWESYAIDYDVVNNSYYSHLTSEDVKHNREIKANGGINEWFIGYSRNRLDKLFYGVTLGIRTYKFEESYIHNETVIDTLGTTFRDFNYSYDLLTKGFGVNLKVGAIYAINSQFRIGAAIHTPSFSELEDTWSANMNSSYKDTSYTVPAELVPEGNYKYKVNTPLKVLVSAAYLFGVKGSVNIELDYIPYQLGRLRSTRDSLYQPYDFEYENSVAKSVFQSGINMRIGGEYVINRIYFLRAGYTFSTAAYKATTDIDSFADYSISGGAGVTINNFKIDLAYVRGNQKRNYYAFTDSKTEINSIFNSIILTGSIRF